ncbi:hypothetical protein [Acinetobacter rudis]|uniref:Uncharacterized protein n=1 Tax=Acinetobacter rudis TaxID=632955 RepID=A0AAW8J4U6_9GAMM|nr:hypothetical protein [Acinetobacter rudis]MDQ8934718.1 hypothetical protein [Acinetobacter rudis]MDQ8951382.1 hypothetical protein [Acinetobacter rudis]MDQ9017201.1 hypothetical protein [Acinetobacter rudis]
MKKLLALSSTLIATMVLTACATQPTQGLAIQKENNQYEVTGTGKTQIIARNNAISAANTTCGKKAQAVVIDEKSEYTGALKGVVSDQTGQLITAAAGVIGTMVGKNNSLEKDTDYQTTLTFSCKATQ